MGRRRHYQKDYVSFWQEKGIYGEIRVARMQRRKQDRYKRMKKRRKDNAIRYGGSWVENGRRIQQCEMGGTCDFPCNGEC